MLFEGFRRRMVFDEDGGGSGGSGNADGDPNGGGRTGSDADGKQNGKPLAYDDWYKAQPEEIRNMLDSNISGLKSALDNERKTRGDLEKQLRELAGKAEKGSEAEKRLMELADQMGEADRKADFYEAAHAAGVSNLKLAYLVALQDDLFDKRGNANFDQMKKDYPELFGLKKIPDGKAGNGTDGNKPAGHGDMNAWIRKAAGRG